VIDSKPRPGPEKAVLREAPPLEERAEELDPDLADSFRNEFTPEAKKAARKWNRIYTESLLLAALAIKDQKKADYVQQVYIDQAAASLDQPQSANELHKTAEFFGAILLGAGLSNLCSMLLSSSFPPLSVVLTVFLTAVGALLSPRISTIWQGLRQIRFRR
jgi:hypothetical protein